MNFETLNVREIGPVGKIELNRPDMANALNESMWKELKDAFEWLDASSLRVAVLSAQGKHFCSGIDIDFFLKQKSQVAGLPDGVRQEQLHALIVELQATISAAETCQKPILAAIQGTCMGAGIDLITACDMRYATHDAKFSVKEVDMAMVADVGTLQRLPSLIGEGLTRELAYTGRTFDGNEACTMGLVNAVFADQHALIKHVEAIAGEIAKKSPQAIRGIKATLNYSRDHSVAEGLGYIALRNSEALFSKDIDEALAAYGERRDAHFPD